MPPNQTAKRLRPFARLALITALPPLVFILTRKPWVLARFVFDGWYVLFILKPSIVSFPMRETLYYRKKLLICNDFFNPFYICN